MLKAAMFDVDGTLVDTVGYEISSWLQALRRFEPATSTARVSRQMGKGADQLLPALLPADLVERHGEEIAELQGEIFRAKYRPAVKAFPKVRALTERLVHDGVRIILTSSGDEADVKHYQELADIADLVGFICCSDDVACSKPRPDIFETALERLGDVRPDETVALGDSPYDAEAAGKLGIPTIGLLCGGAFHRDDLLRAGCIAVYRDAEDLLAHFDRSPLAMRLNRTA